MRLLDKTAIIMGGAGRIGAETVKLFLKEGAKVVIQDFSKAAAQKLYDELVNEYREKILLDISDITKYEQMTAMAKQTEASFGRIDILVNFAGILIHKPIEDLSLEDWKKVIDINLTGAFYAMKAVVPSMKSRKYGKIINTSSVGARTARHGVGLNYSASKGGLISMTKTLAGDLGAFNINVNAIAPGPINSPMFFSQSEENIKILKAGIPMCRLGESSDIANCALFLASDESSWITGQTFDVSGGIVMNS